VLGYLDKIDAHLDVEHRIMEAWEDKDKLSKHQKAGQKAKVE
jgi:hypothetical protein